MGLRAHVDGALASCTVGYGKPRPDYCHAGLEVLGDAPKSVLLWDDSGAMSLGLRAEVVHDAAQCLEAIRTYLPDVQA